MVVVVGVVAVRRRRGGPHGETDGDHADDRGDAEQGRAQQSRRRPSDAGGGRSSPSVPVGRRRGRERRPCRPGSGTARRRGRGRTAPASPIRLVDLGEHRLARLGDGGVDGVLAADQGREQLLGEHDRRPVADRELHRDDSRHAERDRVVAMPANGSVSVVRAPSQELSTRAAAMSWSPSRFANSVSSTSPAAAVVVLEEEHAVAVVGEVAVADVVEDVVVAVAQRLAQAARGRRIDQSSSTRPRSTTPASACSTRRRSSATSSGGRSCGLATTPRMRTAASITRRGGVRPVSRSGRRACAADWRGTRAAVEELPRHAQQFRGAPATASGARRARRAGAMRACS